MIRNFTIVTLFVLFASFSLNAQTCLPDGIVFDTQEAIDNFAVNYPGCTSIDGDVVIQGDEISNLLGLNVLTAFNGDIRIDNCVGLLNLNGLENIQTISGSFTVEICTSLINFNGLENLTVIDGNFMISAGLSLDSFSGLESLTEIGGDLLVLFCPEVVNLSGLNSLSLVGGGILLDLNTNLINVDGLENLTEVGDFLSFSKSPNLSSIASLSNLTSIGGELRFFNVPLLPNFYGLENIDSVYNLVIAKTTVKDMTGLESLIYIGDNMEITENDSLDDLSQLINLSFVGGFIQVATNPMLESLNGLDNIDPSPIWYLYLVNNQILSECELLNICEYIAYSGNGTDIYGNATGCNSRNEVQEACESVSIEDYTIPENIQLYPNPATAEINLRFSVLDLQSSIFIYDIYGRKHFEGAILQEQVRVDVSEYPNGVYFVVLKNEKGLLDKQKFVVSK